MSSRLDESMRQIQIHIKDFSGIFFCRLNISYFLCFASLLLMELCMPFRHSMKLISLAHGESVWRKIEENQRKWLFMGEFFFLVFIDFNPLTRHAQTCSACWKAWNFRARMCSRLFSLYFFNTLTCVAITTQFSSKDWVFRENEINKTFFISLAESFNDLSSLICATLHVVRLQWAAWKAQSFASLKTWFCACGNAACIVRNCISQINLNERKQRIVKYLVGFRWMPEPDYLCMFFSVSSCNYSLVWIRYCYAARLQCFSDSLFFHVDIAQIYGNFLRDFHFNN